MFASPTCVGSVHRAVLRGPCLAPTLCRCSGDWASVLLGPCCCMGPRVSAGAFLPACPCCCVYLTLTTLATAACGVSDTTSRWPPPLCYRAMLGTGKTMLARVVAVQCRANFISVTIPAILSSAVGDSEKALSDVFRLAKTCR
jgi:hypothetical protein